MYENKKYKDYIDEHKNNIEKVWRAIKPILIEKYNINMIAINAIDKNIEHHDDSKFSKHEFEPYGEFYYPIGKKNKDDYDKAWLHHIQNNKHHWNHWLIVNSPTEIIPTTMPFIYIIEMLIDWSSMSLKFGDDVKKYYNKNKKDIIIDKKTKETINKFIDSFSMIVKLLND